jgi:hypothetical protein
MKPKSATTIASDDRLLEARLAPGGGELVAVALFLARRPGDESERVLRAQPAVPFLEGVGVEEHRQPFVSAERRVIAAALADAQRLLELLAVVEFLALGAFEEEVVGNLRALRLRSGREPRLPPEEFAHRPGSPTPHPASIEREVYHGG